MTPRRVRGKLRDILGAHAGLIMVGSVLGSYVIVERIGAGGMGEVFLAKHRRIERRAAIKLLLPTLSKDADIVARFFNEARATSLISHPGIVQILDCDVFQDRAYIVMEYLEGGNLAGVIARNRGVDAPTAIWVAGQIASALSAAHAQGIVHRDLKPENVFLATDPQHPGTSTVKILDFGIAKLAGEKSGIMSHTRTGSILGTPVYMSPEQCRGITTVDHRADIYALGGMLFELLTGRPPFVKEAPGDLLVAHIHEAPPAPSSFQPTVPPDLDQLVLRMLAKAPADRPQTMDIVGRELASLQPSKAIPLSSPISTLRLTSSGSPLVATPPPLQPGTPAPLATPFPRPITPAPSGSLTPSAGGTQLLPQKSTFSMTASEVIAPPPRKRRAGMWIALVGAAAAIGAVVLVLGPHRLSPDASDVKPLPPPIDQTPSRSKTIETPRPALPGEDAPANVTVEIATDPAGAALWLPGASGPRGRTPLRLLLPRGKAPVEATLKAEGYLDRVIALETDRDQSIELRLDRVGKPRHATPHPQPRHKPAPPPHPPAQAVETEAPKPQPSKPEPQKKYFLLGD